MPSMSTHSLQKGFKPSSSCTQGQPTPHKPWTRMMHLPSQDQDFLTNGRLYSLYMAIRAVCMILGLILWLLLFLRRYKKTVRGKISINFLNCIRISYSKVIFSLSWLSACLASHKCFFKNNILQNLIIGYICRKQTIKLASAA